MLKKFISYYKPYKSILILNLFFALIITLNELAFPFISRMIFNDFLPDNDFNNILIYAMVLFFCTFARFIISFNYSNQLLGILIETDIRRDLFIQVEKMDHSFFHDKKIGKLLTNLTSTLNDIGIAAYLIPDNLFTFVIIFLGSFIFLLTINVWLTVIMFVSLIGVVLFSLIKGKKTLETKREIRNTTADMNAEIEKSLNNIMLTKSFGNEKFEIKKFDQKSNLYKKSLINSIAHLRVYLSINTLMIEICNGVLLVAGCYFITKGIADLTIADLVTYFFLLNILIKHFNSLINNYQQAQNGISGFEKYYNLINIKPKIKSKRSSKKFNSKRYRIIFNNVSFSYEEGKEKALADFSLTLNMGSKTAVVGKSGSGKSTITKLIARFYDVDDGQILIGGTDIRNYNIKSLRQAIGIIEKGDQIFWGTIKENIIYGQPKSSMKAVIEAAKKAHLHDFIMELPEGYNTFVGEKGYMLSGGQKQKISIARLFLKNPHIIILDEATNSIDADSEKEIIESLEELLAGRTTIIIAHRLSSIANCDNIIVLDKGKIIEKGTHESLVEKNAAYANLFNLDETA